MIRACREAGSHPRSSFDVVAARKPASWSAKGEDCLFWPPTQMPPPIGYICALKDPDGNVIEFSYDQGVYAKAQEVWGAGA